MSTDTFIWPLTLKPAEQAFFVEPVSARFAAALTGQVQVLARPAEIWRATLQVRAGADHLPWLEAVLAFRAGSSGTLLVPDFTCLTGTGALESFDDYAAGIGQTWFDDATGFEEESGILLLSEDGRCVLGGDGRTVAVLPPPLALATEDGAGLLLAADCALTLDVPDQTGFTEGVGTPRVIGGCRHRLALDGCRPFSSAVLAVGDLIQTSPGRGHLIVTTTAADADGIAVFGLAPGLRAPPVLGPPCCDQVRVLMRLADGTAAPGPVEPPGRTTFTLSLIEALSP